MMLQTTIAVVLPKRFPAFVAITSCGSAMNSCWRGRPPRGFLSEGGGQSIEPDHSGQAWKPVRGLEPRISALRARRLSSCSCFSVKRQVTFLARMEGVEEEVAEEETAEETLARYWTALCIYAEALDAIRLGKPWGVLTDP